MISSLERCFLVLASLMGESLLHPRFCIAYVACELIFVLSYCVINEQESKNFDKFEVFKFM